MDDALRRCRRRDPLRYCVSPMAILKKCLFAVQDSWGLCGVILMWCWSRSDASDESERDDNKQENVRRHAINIKNNKQEKIH
jgi:hypothetical protein